jgi:hypothetical protein
MIRPKFAATSDNFSNSDSNIYGGGGSSSKKSKYLNQSGGGNNDVRFHSNRRVEQ